MYDCDLYGSKAVVALIEQSKHSKFTITRTGAVKQTAPVFQCIHTISTEGAAKEFERWANIMQMGGRNNNAYDIFLFTNFNDTAKVKEGKHPLKMTFCLVPTPATEQTPQHVGSNSGLDAQTVQTLIQSSIENALKAREESEISKRLADIEERLNEEDEEAEEMNGTPQADPMTTLLMAALSNGALFGGNAQANGGASAVNGADDAKQKLHRINTAIQRLHKIDPEIDTDLLKLADIGEKNPDQFKFLLNALRNM